MTALKEFEEKADAAFAKLAVPHPNLHIASWYLLTVSEDIQRWLMLRGEVNDWQLEFWMDRYKFALRHCLTLAQQRAVDRSAMAIPDRVTPAMWIRSREMLFAGVDYSQAAQACASGHSGSMQFSKDGDAFVIIPAPLTDARYGALELMRQSAVDPEELDISMSALLTVWLRERVPPPDVLGAIAESTRLVSRHIRYHFDPHLTAELAAQLPQPPQLVPAGWSFPWGGQYETSLLVASFSLRVMYHFCAVQSGASARRLAGGAEYDLVLCMSEGEWVRDIHANSSLPLQDIHQFVRYLTNGQGVTSPDQALQPFVPLGAGRLAVPGISVLSSNLERNLLTLQARIEPQRFNGQSALFEQLMTERIRAKFARQWTVVANRTFSIGAQEEIDLLVCEPGSRTLLILELRWMLPPADPREVQTKKRVCAEKVLQARRKRNAVRANLRAVVLAAFEIQIAEQDAWKVQAAVIVEGFGGGASADPEIPVVPHFVLEAGAQPAGSLRRLAQWLASDDWFPVEGTDFEIAEMPPTLLGMSVRTTGFAPLSGAHFYLERVIGSLQSTPH